MFVNWLARLNNKQRWIIGLGCFFGIMPLIGMIMLHQYAQMTPQLFISIATVWYAYYTKKKYDMEDSLLQKEKEEAANKVAKNEAERRRVAQQVEEKKQKEFEKQIKPYADMDRIINCPICGGTGKAYFHCMDCNVDGEYDHQMRRAITEDIYNERLEEWGDAYAYANEGVYLSEGYCPFCNGTGAVKARFEKSVDGFKDCDTCTSTGKIKKQIKLDVGIGYVDETCPKCYGKGKLADYGNVYIQTALKTPQTDTHRYEVGGGYNFIFNVKDRTGSTDDSRFMVKIDDQNKDFYSVSKPIDD